MPTVEKALLNKVKRKTVGVSCWPWRYWCWTCVCMMKHIFYKTELIARSNMNLYSSHFSLFIEYFLNLKRKH